MVLSACLALAGCHAHIPLATKQSEGNAPRRYATHTFSFDTNGVRPEVLVRDFHYGGSNFPGVRGCPPHPVPCPWPFRSTLAHGHMEVAEQIFIEWIYPPTATLFRDVITLGPWLPKDMEGARVVLTIAHGTRAHVFVVGPNKADENACPDMAERARLIRSYMAQDRVFGQFCYLQITQIYPRNPFTDVPVSIQLKKARP